MVDDGSEGQFGKEIEFRAHLEAELRKGRPLKYYEAQRNKKKYDEEESPIELEEDSLTEVPMILIVVQGGPNTLITVEESLKQMVPVLVLAVSSSCFS